MRRNATLLIVLVLLAGSAAAFAVAEHLKVERSPVAGPEIDKVFSPVCNCPQQRAAIAFRLRKAGELTLSLIDPQGHEVRRLVDHVHMDKGRQTFFWNGRDAAGRLVSEGSFRPKIELGNHDRTIVLPNPIRVDMTRPAVVVLSVAPRVISPDGDGRGDVARIRYRVNERAQVTLFIDGSRRVVSRSRRPVGQLEWFAGGSGVRRLPPGIYRLAVEAQDLAGNLSRRVPAGPVRIRYLALVDSRLIVRPGQEVRVRVRADARRIGWLLRHGSSVLERGVARRRIVFEAPAKPGRYTLVAQAGPHRASTVLVVRNHA